MERLNRRFGAALTWYVPLGLRKWFTAAGVATVVELDWWQSARHSGTKVYVTLTPAQVLKRAPPRALSADSQWWRPSGRQKRPSGSSCWAPKGQTASGGKTGLANEFHHGTGPTGPLAMS